MHRTFRKVPTATAQALLDPYGRLGLAADPGVDDFHSSRTTVTTLRSTSTTVPTYKAAPSVINDTNTSQPRAFENRVCVIGLAALSRRWT
jgi:hypothetical protein